MGRARMIMLLLLLSAAVRLPAKADAMNLPDPLILNSGRPVESPADWNLRRREMTDVLLDTAYGHPPTVPEVSIEQLSREIVALPGLEQPAVKIRALLSFGPDNALQMQAGCWLPGQSQGPHPALLAIEPVWWEAPFLKHEIVQQVLGRGYALAGFDHNALASYEDAAVRAAKEAYPEQDWGTVAAVAWGCSIALNWLEGIPEVDGERIAVWGHSRRGKSALLAGALDTRFAAVLPHMSGMAGSALYRVSGPGAQRLDQLLERYWLREAFFAFSGRKQELPFDQHWLHALVAPRPLFIYVGLHDAWGNPAGEQAAVEAAMPVYEWLGRPENLRMTAVDKGHVDPGSAEGATSWAAALDFLDNHLATPKQVTADPLIGVSYFAGWWRPLPNKWHDAQGNDWRARFPERVPLLGEYNTQAVMDREIAAAADHGVDFFAILWYYNPPGEEREPNARFLERGLKCFMDSPEAHRMQFMIEFCNHPPYEVQSQSDWAFCVEQWVRWMGHPSYLRVNGKPVFKVHGGHHFMVQNDHDLARCRAQLAYLRDAARKAGLGELLIGCGVGAHEAIGPDHFAAQLFDFTGTYMDLPPLPRRDEDYPYRVLDAFITEGRDRHVNDAVPHMPFVGAGWAPHPWPDPRACFALPGREQWRASLERLARDLADHEQLGLPGAKAFTIYAWNEFGEGGFIAPTRGDHYRKLEVLREVFDR